MTTINFNLNEFKSGRIATNKVGQQVRFITECRNEDKILVSVKSHTGVPPFTMKYNKEGKLYNNTPSVYDLHF